jgi:hypothetical protein
VAKCKGRSDRDKGVRNNNNNNNNNNNKNKNKKVGKKVNSNNRTSYALLRYVCHCYITAAVVTVAVASCCFVVVKVASTHAAPFAHIYERQGRNEGEGEEEGEGEGEGG